MRKQQSFPWWRPPPPRLKISEGTLVRWVWPKLWWGRRYRHWKRLAVWYGMVPRAQLTLSDFWAMCCEERPELSDGDIDWVGKMQIMTHLRVQKFLSQTEPTHALGGHDHNEASKKCWEMKLPQWATPSNNKSESSTWKFRKSKVQSQKCQSCLK